MGRGALAAETPVAADLDALVAKIVAHARADPDAAAVIVDNTSSDAVADRYGEWLARGVHVVTPNKKANSGDLARFRRFRASADESGAKWLYEGTIGAGLPVVSTLRTLRASGDRVRSVQGIFSGTMSFLFNTWDPGAGQPFSDVVLAAKKAGYTEPDPRDDLNGLDVARKVVIAARESGVDLALDDVDVQSLVPAELEDCDVAEYERRLPEFDGVIAEQAAAAAAEGKVLRFVGKVDAEKGTGSVELSKFDASHPFAGLQGADNILEISTARYSDEMSSTPLIIRGPGRGGASHRGRRVRGPVQARGGARARACPCEGVREETRVEVGGGKAGGRSSRRGRGKKVSVSSKLPPPARARRLRLDRFFLGLLT